MLGIYVAGAISGAHLNPAVTLALAVRGKVAGIKCSPIWLHSIGSIYCRNDLYFVYQGAIVNATGANNVADAVGGRLLYITKGFCWHLWGVWR